MKKIVYLFILLFTIVFILTGCDFGFDHAPTETDKQYEIFLLAKTAGYEGTYEEWLASIKGEKGDPGKDGIGILSIEKTSTDGLVDTYTIYFTDGTTTTFTVTNGKDGLQGIQGEPGKDGHIPVITIENGYWYIDGVNTLQPAQGVQGETGNGISSIEKTSTEGLVDTYTIYFTDGTTTTFTVTNGKDEVTIIDVLETNNTDNLIEYTILLSNGQKYVFSIPYNKYIHSVPKSTGVYNAIQRARALTDIKWTPLNNVPGVVSMDDTYSYQEFIAGIEYQGIPYSGVINTDTYVGMTVSLETFISAVYNNNSVLYSKNLYSENYPKAATYYGTVCSKFVQYALNIHGAYNTGNVLNIEGVELISKPKEYGVYDLELGDIIVDPINHTAMITDIVYNYDGSIAYIEVSEAVMPLCRRVCWTVDEFKNHFSDYYLARYKFIDKTPSTDNDNDLSKYANYPLMPEYGDKYNYKLNNKGNIKINILKEGYKKAVILKDGNIENEILLDDTIKTIEVKKDKICNFEVYLIDENNNKSESVYGAIVSSTIDVTNTENFLNGSIDVVINGSSGVPYYIQIGSVSDSNYFSLLETDINDVKVLFSKERVHNLQVRVAYKNEYGIYLSDWTKFSLEPNKGNAENLSNDDYLKYALLFKGMTLLPNDSNCNVVEGKENHWTYQYIPIKGNVTYYSKGATRLWYYDYNKQPISTYNAYKDGLNEFEFMTPYNACYVGISYSPNLVLFGEEKIEVVKDGNTSIENLGTLIEGFSLSPTNSNPLVIDGKNEYWTICYIEVESNKEYYASGGNRLWFYDSNKKPISTMNILTESSKVFFFKTPDNAKYVSISYSPDYIKRGDEILIKIE